jgi:hypothetical protein
MNRFSSVKFRCRLSLFCACAGLAISAAHAQAAGAAVYEQIDAAVQHQASNVAAISDVEKYDVYRDGDEVHPVAEVIARMTYRRGVGRSYQILSQRGSTLIRKFGLIPLLNHEVHLSAPGTVEHTWFTTSNYQMKLKSKQLQNLHGRECYVVAINPRHKAPNMIDGTLWVDAKDFSIVKVEGVASRRPSILAGTTHMMREYEQVRGYPMATKARAVSDGGFIGRTVVTIEYSDYHLLLRPTPVPEGGESIADADTD